LFINSNVLFINKYRVNIYEALFPREEDLSLKEYLKVDEKFKLDENILSQNKIYNVENVGIPNNEYYNEVNKLIDFNDNDFINIESNKIYDLGDKINSMFEKHIKLKTNNRYNINLNFKYNDLEKNNDKIKNITTTEKIVLKNILS
jgi:hypothetical protein